MDVEVEVYEDGQALVIMEDALEALKEIPDASVHSIVTDPPYNLSSSKSVLDCLRRIVTEVEFPQAADDSSLSTQSGDLGDPLREVSDLNGVSGAVREHSGVGVPESAVDFQDPSITELEVADGDESAMRSTDGDLSLEAQAELGEHLGDFVLQVADDGNSAFCDGTCSCFTEPTLGVLAVSIRSIGSALRPHSGVVLSGQRVGHSYVGSGDDSWRDPETAASVMAGGGPVDGGVLRLDLRGATGELSSAHGTFQRVSFDLVRAPQGVGTGAGTSGLSAVAQAYHVRLVDDSAHRTLTLHVPVGVRHLCHLTPTGGFMGKQWDGWSSQQSFQRWCQAWAVECLRVLKPGGHMLAFGGARTYHRLACAIEDAGFEIRDSVQWLYGSGFPKSLDVSKAIDKQRGVDRKKDREVAQYLREQREALGLTKTEVDQQVFGGSTRYAFVEGRDDRIYLPTPSEWVRLKDVLRLDSRFDSYIQASVPERESRHLVDGGKATLVAESEGDFGYQSGGGRWSGTARTTMPSTDEAQAWQGWGTALKPGYEPIVVARKPLSGTVAANVLEHGTGALNIDASRIGVTDSDRESWKRLKGFNQTPRTTGATYANGAVGPVDDRSDFSTSGRWPANVILSHHADCVEVGTREVKTGTAGPQSGGWGRFLREGDSNGTEGSYADGSGREAVVAYECHPDCPARLLDAQSGPAGAAAPASGPTHEGFSKSSSMAGSFNGMGDQPAKFHADSGGASRFFATFHDQHHPECKVVTEGCVPGCPVAELDDQSGERRSSGVYNPSGVGKFSDRDNATTFATRDRPTAMYDDSGGASRFFYVAKAPRKERPEGPDGTKHPTCKPLTLMRYLVRMVTPPGGVVLDPFAGSGTTGEAAIMDGFRAWLIEREATYHALIDIRLRRAFDSPQKLPLGAKY